MRVPRVVLLVFLAATASGQKEAFVPANDVSFTIATEHRQYPAGERVFVRYEGNAHYRTPEQMGKNGRLLVPFCGT